MTPRRGKAPIKLGSDGKASVYNAGDLGSIPGSGRLPGEGNGNPLQYCHLGNPMNRGAWWNLQRNLQTMGFQVQLNIRYKINVRIL